MRRTRPTASRSLELFTSMVPTGGKNQNTKISAAIAVAMSPLNKPSSLEMASTASKSRSIEASLPMFSRWQNAAVQSTTIVERRVPGRHRTRNTRARSTENAAPMESIKKVPQTPRRQPAINPAVKPPITSPWKENVRPCFRQVNRQARPKTGDEKSNASAETSLQIMLLLSDGDDELHAAGRFLSDLPTRS